MGSLKNKQKIGQNFLPFCAGIACGILLSVLLFLTLSSPAMFKQIWYKSGQDEVINYPAMQRVKMDSSYQHSDVVRERKLSQDNGVQNHEVNSNQSIPIDFEPDLVAVENKDWEQNISPVHIPGYLSQELKLKRKVFVAVLSHSSESVPIVNLAQITWMKDWVQKRNGDISIYASPGIAIEKHDDIKISRVTATDENANEPSPSMLYQALTDMCSQHVDTHHHFYIVSGNTYVNLPQLLNFTNHLDDSKALWIGKKVDIGKERHYTNDPGYHCSLGPGFVLTRHGLQKLCPHLPTCRLEYSSTDVATGFQFARCVLRFLNQTCTYPIKDYFYQVSSSKELFNPYDPSCPYKESISVYPVMKVNSLIKLHHFHLSLQLNYTNKENDYYHKIIQDMDRVLVQEGGMADDRLILGRHGNDNKYLHGDVITWDRVEAGSNKIFLTDHSEPSKDLTKTDLIALKKIKALALKQIDKNRQMSSSFGDVFRRVVPGVGYQYMVDIMCGNDELVTVYVDQPYSRMQPLSTVTAPNVKVTFVLPFQDGSSQFKEFMQMFEQACMSVERAKNVALLVVLYHTTYNQSKHVDDRTSESLNLLNLYKQKYPDLSLRWINSASNAFSHIDGTVLAVRALPVDTLICSVDLFTRMSPEFLHHARLNTVLGDRLFFPVAFQELPSEANGIHEISKNSGFWRSFDYNLFCGYKQDIIGASGGEAFSSGADLFERALASGLDAFRAPEHSLSVKWHQRDCSDRFLADREKTLCEESLKRVHLASSISLK